MLRRNIYKWHRTCSLIIALPVVLWASSGFMHPIMTTIRPKVATQSLIPWKVDSSKLHFSLKDALQKNSIAFFHNARLVHIDTNWFYQVQQKANENPVYLSTVNGKRLPNGDMLYARYIAKQFLEGQEQPTKQPNIYAAALPVKDVSAAMDAHDCCDAATSFVLLNEKGAGIKNVFLLNNFNSEYKFINHLLPVYKVSFDRADGIRIYVETTSDRFAFAMDNKRAVFDTIFGLFHTWEWLNMFGNAKYFIMVLLTGMAFLTTLMGLYIFFTTKTKKANGNTVMKARKRHRITSVCIALFTLMFTGSGAYHAFSKLTPDTTSEYFSNNQFATTGANFNIGRLQQLVPPGNSITNIGFASMKNETYWQIFLQKNQQPASEKNGTDLMKSMAAIPVDCMYVKATDYSVLTNGEAQYAASLAGLFSKQPATNIRSSTLITKFGGEYGFINKRLPVWKISYSTNSNERFYVETSSGKLAAHINDKNLIEGYSFALFHKHEFMAWAGKPVKDFSTMFWAAAQILMVAIGLTLYIKMQKRKKQL